MVKKFFIAFIFILLFFGLGQVNKIFAAENTDLDKIIQQIDGTKVEYLKLNKYSSENEDIIMYEIDNSNKFANLINWRI